MLLVAAALLLWRMELFTVERSGDTPKPLDIADASSRAASIPFDVTLPSASAGVERVRPDGRALLVHYWAPWEHQAAAQVDGLDSLRRLPGLEPLRVVVVCFDPFPSVARYVARRRLRLSVLLDTGGALRRRLVCPSIPFTYVLDDSGRIAARQPGTIDWLNPVTIERLRALASPSASSPPPDILAPDSGRAKTMAI